MAAHVAGLPGGWELVARVEAAIGANDAAGLVSALLAFRAQIPRGYHPAESALLARLRNLAMALRMAVIRELMDRVVGRSPAELERLGAALGLVAERDYPGRRGLLADLQLYAVHPESLRGPLRAALLADAAAWDTGLPGTAQGADSACAALIGRLDDAERRSVARWVMAFGKALWSEDSCLTRSRYDSLGGSLARRRLNWTVEETAELLRASRHGHCIGHPEAARMDGLQENELRFALPAAEHLSDADLRTLLPELRTIVDDLDAGRLGISAFRQAKTAPRRFHTLPGRAAPGAVAAAGLLRRYRRIRRPGTYRAGRCPGRSVRRRPAAALHERELSTRNRHVAAPVP